MDHVPDLRFFKRDRQRKLAEGIGQKTRFGFRKDSLGSAFLEIELSAPRNPKFKVIPRIPVNWREPELARG
jgi:hypothetical protein